LMAPLAGPKSSAPMASETVEISLIGSCKIVVN
jgi:hypothetical protein